MFLSHEYGISKIWISQKSLNLTRKGSQNGAALKKILLLTNHVTDVVSLINNLPNQNVSKSLNTTRDGGKYSY